jgi:hypothetical protein
MTRLLPCVYLVLFAVASLGGFSAFGSWHARIDVGWTLVGVSFLGLLALPFLAIGHARSRTTNRLASASFSRGFAGGWWLDPLQWLRVTTLLLGGLCFGSLFTLPHATSQETMVVWWYTAMALGSVMGELAALRTFRASIG